MPVGKMIIRAFVAAVFAVLGAQADGFAQTLPAGWASKDIGSVGIAGSATADASTFVVNGGGADVWGSSDAFRFAYTALSGDGSIVAQVTGIDNINSWTKAGVMMRETLAANSRQAFMMVTPGKGLAFQRRKSTGGSSTHTAGGTGTAPYYLKLTRAGSTITAYKSLNNSTWTKVGSDTISMASTIYVGLAVSSHITGVLASADFARTVVSQATIAVPPPAPAPQSSQLRLLQWNTHHGGIGSDGVYDPARIAAWIAKMNPDVASLNEVDTTAQANAIVSALKAKTGVTWNVSYSGWGNLLISRLPVSAQSKCAYDPSIEVYAPHLNVIVNGRTINIWSAHLHVSSASARLTEVKALQACARGWAEGRIITGDFNMQKGSTEYLAATVGYTDAWLATKALGTATNFYGNCDGCTRNSRIDYVFTSTGATALVLKSSQIFDTRDARGVTPSDHKPMLVTYEVK